MKVYLAGPIAESGDPHSWRNRLIEQYPGDNVTFVNPLDYHDFSTHKVAPSKVVSTDKSLLQMCDSVVVRREAGVETWGTPMEVMWANERGYSINAWNPNDSMPSPWLTEHVNSVVGTTDSLYTQLQTL